MHYYSSADEPFFGAPTYLLCPHFNFMELKWGGAKKSGGPKKILWAPHFQFAYYAPGELPLTPYLSSK